MVNTQRNLPTKVSWLDQSCLNHMNKFGSPAPPKCRFFHMNKVGQERSWSPGALSVMWSRGGNHWPFAGWLCVFKAILVSLVHTSGTTGFCPPGGEENIHGLVKIFFSRTRRTTAPHYIKEKLRSKIDQAQGSPYKGQKQAYKSWSIYKLQNTRLSLCFR